MLDRSREVYELRLTGKKFSEIADICGYATASGAWQACKRFEEELVFESVEEIRQLELMRLDELHRSIWENALLGHLPSISSVLKIMERRAKLLGLDEPNKGKSDSWADSYNWDNLDEDVKRIASAFEEREEDFVKRKEKELRAQIRLELELESRAEEKAKPSVEEARQSILDFLNQRREILDSEKPSEI